MRASILRAVVASSLLLSSGTAVAAPQTGSAPAIPRKIVVISMPSVGWEDVRAGLTPNLETLAGDWPLGSLSLRTVGSRTDLPSAMASIGAGNRARGIILPLAQGDLFSAPNAVPGPGGSLKVRGMRHVAADNAQLSFGARPGLLGQQLHAMGLETGVAGNADGGVLFSTSTNRIGSGRDLRRFGALALADTKGRVDHGLVGDELAVRDNSTLNGYRTNLPLLLRAAGAVIEKSDVALIELADGYREGLIAFADLPGVETTAAERSARNRGIRRDDAALGEILKMVDLRRDSLLFLSPAGLGYSEPERLSVASLAGVGAGPHGWLTSAVTLRDGLVTLSDVGPGILRLLGRDQPDAMSGQPLHSTAGPRTGRIEKMVALGDNAVFHGRWVGLFFALFVFLQSLLYLVAWRRLRLESGRTLEWLRRFCLAFMATPVAVLALVPLRPQRWGPLGPLSVILVVCALVVVIALAGPWRKFPAGPPTFVAALTLLVIAADLLTGANLQLSSLVGYSPVVAGRFYGIGNLTFALLATSALLLSAQLGTRWKPHGIWAAAALGVFTILVDGHPRLGADFGGVLALLPGFGVLLLVLSGRRITLVRGAVLAASAVAAGLILGILDSMRPVDEQTHIGRFIQRLLEQGPGGVAEIIQRKALANWSLLTQSVLSISIPVALVFLAIMLRSPHGKLPEALETQPGLRQGLIAAVVTNLLGFALNDSGVAIPAMGLAMAAPFCLATILGLPRKLLEE